MFERVGKSVVVCVLLAFAAVSCTGGSSDSTSQASGGSSGAVKSGGFLRIAAGEGIDSLNPFVGINDDSYSAWVYMYPEIDQIDTKTLDYIPDFATSWDHSSDGLTWTFHTVPDAKWSDGEPLTAEDVAWTYNTIIKFRKGATGALGGSATGLEKVVATDPATAVFHYDHPVASVLSDVQGVPILPEHVWSKYAAGDGKALKTYPNTPSKDQPVVSGGPFVVTQYQQDAVTLFETNPNYYGTAPHIDGFGLQYFSNEDAEVTALKNGEIDAIELLPSTSVDTVKQAGFNVYIGPGLTYRTFIINSNPDKTSNRELLDPQVKMAFEYAIDRQEIIRTAWLGYGQPGSTIVPTSTGKWHDPSIQPLPYDLQKANTLLDQAGFARGADGIRVADGHPMTYDVIFPQSERGAGDRAFQIIQSSFHDIGVKLVQKPVTGAYSVITAPNNKYDDFDLAMWNWTPSIDPDFILAAMTCDSWGDWNDSGYCNPAYDKLYQQQRRTIDVGARHDLVYQMQKMVFDDRPYIVLNYNETIDAWSPKWTGFVQSVQGFFPFLSKQSLTSVHQT
jgi:peptide/nickel transport system substrate-binding protein